MKSIRNIIKEDLDGKWICKELTNCDFAENCFLIFRDGKMTFYPTLPNLDYQLKYDEKSNTMFLEFKQNRAIEIWLLFPDKDKESMIIKMEDKKYYFERVS